MRLPGRPTTSRLNWCLVSPNTTLASTVPDGTGRAVCCKLLKKTGAMRATFRHGLRAMNSVTISIPPMFLPVVDELVQLTQSGNREQWMANVVRGVVIDYQVRKEFSQNQQARAQQLSGFWTGLPPFPNLAPAHRP